MKYQRMDVERKPWPGSAFGQVVSYREYIELSEWGWAFRQ